MEAMARLAHPAGAVAQDSTGEFILYAIWLRLLETARSIQQSCYAGYARDQQPLARSMVNSACDLIFIAETETPSRALLWAYFSIERRRRIGEGYVRVGLMTQQEFDGWDATVSSREQSAIAEAEGKGIKPYPKFNQDARRQTWTGLTDADLIRKVGRNDWYDAYYVPFSDAAHGSIMSAVEEIHQLRAGPITVGPRYSPRILLHVIMCAGDTLTRALETLDKHFKLGAPGDIEAQKRTLLARLNEYSATLPALPDPAEA